MRAIAPAATLLAAALVLAACKPTSFTAPDGAAQPAAAPSTEPATATSAATGADDNLNAVLWVQRSAEYQANAISIFRAAADHLDAALAQANWDALVPAEREQAAPAAGLEPAVIMDIDETVLDNSPYQARLVGNGLEYDEVTWDQWVAEKKARPVPGVLAFAKAAEAKGVTILYLSNRAVHLQEATLANLREAGLPVKDDSVFLGLGTHVEGCEQNGSEKLCRRRLAGREYRVLMQFGDQLGDFVEVVANTPEARAALLEEYRDWFGERWWMLANPTYGSWEPAVFNNAWSEPREARRAMKREALLHEK
ncbi:acid phosphatase [Luteimonas marina]|uniref:Acid phosphatase n=1 Tax=Luteimonas marina TaxID=488485 RepID=A0A5C5TVE4_9GAMM|nr:HAD family acid phosphatase [Luteimonas marina]TWT18171.1 acid phosphatase [Luteimonas marina]